MDKIKKFLCEHEDKANAEFQKGLLVTNYYVYGVKTRILQQFANVMAAEVVNPDTIARDSFEEILLAGMVIAKMKIAPSEKIKYFDNLVEYFDNWAHCDMIVSRLKRMESESEYFESLLTREGVFVKRSGIIFIMSHLLKNDVASSLTKILSVKDKDYYIQMAQAWAIANAGVYDYDYVYKLLPSIDNKFLRNKAISKMCDSYRISSLQKEELKKLRIK